MEEVIGAKILSVKDWNPTDDDPNAFRLEIETNKGTLVYKGSHDCEPELIMKESE